MIDLSTYSKQALSALHKSGMACVYVLSYEGGNPSRIGYAKKPHSKISEIRRSNAQPVELNYLTWTPSLGTAIAIEYYTRDLLLAQGVFGSPWLKSNVDITIDAMNRAVKALYPNAAHIVPHVEMLKRLENVA